MCVCVCFSILNMKVFIETKAPGKRTPSEPWYCITSAIWRFHFKHNGNKSDMQFDVLRVWFWCKIVASCKSEMVKRNFILDLTLINQSGFSSSNIWKHNTRSVFKVNSTFQTFCETCLWKKKPQVSQSTCYYSSFITWSCEQQCDFCIKTIKCFLTDNTSKKAYRQYLKIKCNDNSRKSLKELVRCGNCVNVVIV